MCQTLPIVMAQRLPTGIMDILVAVVSRAGPARMRLAGSWPAWRRVQIRDDSGGGQRGWGTGSPWTSSSAHAVLPVTVSRTFPLAGQAIHAHLPARQSTRANPEPGS